MEVRFRLTFLRVAITLVALAVIGIGGALLIAWTGVYNVAASRGHPVWLNEFLELGMRRSVESNSSATPPAHIELDDPDLVQLGAAHFRGGCAPCHAAPGETISPVFAGMLPSPPRLEERVKTWKDQDLHWIVYHGLQYAGMPAWSGDGREDEVWALVSFLRRLPDLDQSGYMVLANRTETPGVEVGELLVEGHNSAGLTACARCHDTAQRDPASALTPALGGQSAAYIRSALEDYRANRRQSGIMEPVAAELDDEQIAGLANYYSGLTRQRSATAPSDASLIEQGAEIASNGIPDSQTPACMSCHSGVAEETYPLLAGLSENYIAGQLRLFRDSQRVGTAQSDLMAQMASGLEDADIAAVSAYFASTGPTTDTENESGEIP